MFIIANHYEFILSREKQVKSTKINTGIKSHCIHFANNDCSLTDPGEVWVGKAEINCPLIMLNGSFRYW